LDLAREVSSLFRINKNHAEEIIKEVVSAVKIWREEATKMGIERSEQEQMQSAFRAAESPI